MTDDPIAALNRVFLDAMKSGDVARLVAHIEDGIVFMPPADTTLYGKQEVEEWYNEYFEFFVVKQLDVTERTSEMLGDCIVERWSVSVRIEPRQGGTDIYDEARILSVWRKQPDGAWKMWQSMWNSVKPIGAGTTRFLVRFMQRERP